MRFRRWQILSNIALRLQIFCWKSNLQFRFLFCRNIIVEFTLISSETVTSTLRGKCTLASQTFFRSNVEKFECSSRERATRYDRNIRACDWIDIRDRAYSAPLSLSRRRKWESQWSRTVSAIYFLEYHCAFPRSPQFLLLCFLSPGFLRIDHFSHIEKVFASLSSIVSVIPASGEAPDHVYLAKPVKLVFKLMNTKQGAEQSAELTISAPVR